MRTMSRRDKPEPEPVAADDSSIKQVISFRLPPKTVAWLKREGAARGWSMNETVYRLVEDVQGWFGFPPTITDQFEADRESLGLDWRQYLMHLLTRRYEEVRKNGPGFDRGTRP